MSRRRTVPVLVSEILDQIVCAEDYGHQGLMGAFADWLSLDLSDEEIEAYAASYLTPEKRKQGYSEEDAEIVRTRLTEWRHKWCRRGRQ